MPSYIDQISNSGPKVWYRFNETSGTPVNFGSLSTTSSFTDLLLNEQTSVDGRATYLNGSSSYIQLPAHAEFALFNDRSFTVEAWVKIANADTNRTSPLEIFRLNAPSTPHYVVSLTVDGTAGTRGKVRLSSSWTTDIVSTNTIDNDEWHHIVYTYNTSSVKLYIDGALNSSTTPTSLPASFNFDQSSKKLIGAGYVGTSQSSISQYFKGRIDEFAAYDYELTSTNILANFNAGASVENAAGSFGTATSLMVQPTVFASFNPAAQAPMTASAASGDHYNSTVYFPTTLNTYLSGLTLETWYKFNTLQQLTNYGSLATKVSVFGPDAYTDPTTGIQGSGVLRTTGGFNASVTNLLDNVGATIADKDFSYGCWVKKTTAEQAAIVTFVDSPGAAEYISTYWNSTGGITTNARLNNGDHIITSATDITDNNWHYVAVRQSGNTLQMWIDGTSIGTQTITHSFAALDTLTFGNGGTTVTEKMYISQFYAGTAANITSTQIAAIYAAGTTGEMQASAYMPEAKAKFNSSFNDYIVSKSPILDFRLDEGAGAPLDFGSGGTIVVSQLSPQGYTQGNISLNTKAFRFTDRLQVVRGTYSLPSGTLSSSNLCTIGVLFKNANATNQQGIVGFGGRGGTQGTGFSLQQLASSGYLRIIAGNSNGTTTNFTGTTNVADNKWHLAVIVKEASTIKLYIDGKLDITASSSNTLTDAGEFSIAAVSGIDALTASRDTLIDEIFVTAGTFTQQEAFEAYQALRIEMDTTATATAVQPTTTLGTGATISAAPATASGLLPMPTETQEIRPTITSMYVTALFAHPNYGANAVIDVNYGTTSMIANAEFHLPQYNIGEINAAASMDASATMVHPQSIAGGKISVNPGIADARMVQPGLATTLGALVKPQSLNAKAFMVIPPAYYLPTDDRWYQVMLDVNTNLTDSVPTIKFFNSPATIYSGGEWNNFQAVTSQNGVTTPLPAAYTGFFDSTSRAALNIRNIALQLSASTSSSDSWTMESYIQTSKANQYLFTTKKENSYPSQNTGSAIALKNGKITFIASNSTNVETGYETFSGFKNIADGNWHHIIIQYFGGSSQNRVQVWIDGKLDIQRYGYTPYIPGRVGYNSANVNLYSDFNISGFAINSPSIINERDTSLHYFAAIGHEPYLATPATATATFGTGTRGKGNRARALMLYFWPTFNAASGYYVGQYNNPFAPVGVNDTEGRDVGGDFDYDTFYGLTTYLTQSTQQFFDWDVFPLPVQKFYAGDTYKGDRNPLLKDTVKIGQGPEGTTYIDEVTDNYRYLNLIKDVYELDQYDAIFFRNYPDQSSEQDKQGLNSKTEVDEYFNLQEKTLFKEFLESLRQAVDEYGISLFVTNPQLAVDLGIIEAATPVDLMRDAGNFLPDEFSDNRAPVLTGRIDSTGNTLDPVNQYAAGWYDTFFNDRHRVINTLEYLTDDNTFIWTDYAFYQHSDELNYGGADKLYKRYENRPYGLQIGDEFVFADSGNPRFRLPYQAIKPEHLKAGIPITALGTTAHLQNFDSYQQGPNPYKDYITTVALPAGTNLNGKLTGGKIFVSFSENVANSFTAAGSQYGTDYTEYHEYDMASNFWVDIAYNAKIIDANTQALYKNNTISDAERGQPPLYDDNALIKQYWSLSGDNIISQAVPVTRSLKGFVGGDIGPEVPEQNKKRTRSGLASLPPAAGTRLRDALGRFASGGGAASVTGGNLNTFKILTGRIYDTGTVFIPSINTRGLWWLSDKNIIEGKVVGGIGMSAAATIPNPIVTADHPASVTANHMLAQAALVDNTSGTKNNLALPLTATVFMPTLGGRTIVAEKAEGFGFMPNIYPLTETDYTVTLYLNHTDPILYIRKEVIK